MRETKVGGVTFEVRPFTRKEILGGREHGLRYWGLDLKNENFDAACDYCLGLLFTDDQLDPLTVKDVRELFLVVIAENWGSEDEEKNLSGSGENDQTLTEK